MTGSDRLETLTPFLELVRISNLAIKGIIEVNSCKNRSKLFQPSDINHVLRWSKLAKLFPRLFQSVPFVSLFCEIFYCTNFLQIACVLLRLSEGRFACLTLCLVLVTK